MSLSKNSINELQNELQTKESIIEIIKDLQSQNIITRNKVIRLVIFFIFAILITILTINKNKFSTVFFIFIDSSINMCVCLLGLLIAGFSIVISSLHKNSLYCIILNHENKNSQYKKTILNCIEPLIWFTLLLIISILFKLLYSEIPNIDIYLIKIILKSISLFTITMLILESLCSLEMFILNMYNLLVTYANWEVLERYAKSKSQENSNISIETIISNLENELNNSTNSSNKE